jgi:hypothetical protein
VTYNSPTEIEIDFDSSAAGDGFATITLINPDGQEVDFLLEVGDATIFADGFESGDTSAWSLTQP